MSLLHVGEVRSIVPPPLLLLLPPLLLPRLRRLTLGVSDVRSIGSETGRFLDICTRKGARVEPAGSVSKVRRLYLGATRGTRDWMIIIYGTGCRALYRVSRGSKPAGFSSKFGVWQKDMQAKGPARGEHALPLWVGGSSV